MQTYPSRARGDIRKDINITDDTLYLCSWIQLKPESLFQIAGIAAIWLREVPILSVGHPKGLLPDTLPTGCCDIRTG